MPRNCCYDCAVCTGRMELDLGRGRTPQEVVALARSCRDCGHTLHRHQHAPLRRHGYRVSEETFPVGPPSRESRLGQMLVERGRYDDFHRHLRRDLPEPRE